MSKRKFKEGGVKVRDSLVDLVYGYVVTNSPKNYKEVVDAFPNEKPKSVKRTYFFVKSSIKDGTMGKEANVSISDAVIPASTTNASFKSFLFRKFNYINAIIVALSANAALLIVAVGKFLNII